ncbi:hypothetical protein FOF72_05265 [Lactobacillus jensenii]|jgi:hypothetical protein|uniref:Uncharacterized protein n=1 Tax=Lactobacillus jensenii TaxID=109790 RepID=A0A2I1XPR1_LACJE|nr:MULTISPECIES: hypothetical protein [Lactobacillus]ERJ42941.1 hypothetical protein N581_09955 [Lactobacillus jensenii MD IIE-70(2)]MCZ3543292.1 hypothetical protein [Lactobacillus gasseri]EEX28223.1 hypothetical protein HMPREF0527_00458 [Lactobacillus jensenii SJ-7A-US]KAA9233656.1 hypothetical protein F6I36_08030 [Lactobacillus jensenii]KAA9258438.1 hypothetical protein F6I24_05150 [Lactobacillus jensenii]
MNELSKQQKDNLRLQAESILNSVYSTAGESVFQLVDVDFKEDSIDFVLYLLNDTTFKVTVSYNRKIDKEYQPIFKEFYEEKIEHE